MAQGDFAQAAGRLGGWLFDELFAAGGGETDERLLGAAQPDEPGVQERALALTCRELAVLAAGGRGVAG